MNKKKKCGIVMPISLCDGMEAHHWTDVLFIVESAASEAGFDARLVSDTFESNLIHKEILQNIYQDDMVICDVSGRNPNVFFELGIRMATQKPTVIIKDDKTAYPFDTGPNRYIEYPRDLRHPKMEKFKSDLVKSIKATSEQEQKNSFIGQLGPFQIPDVESTELPASDIILDRLDRLDERLRSISTKEAYSRSHSLDKDRNSLTLMKRSEDRLEILIQGYGHTQVENGIDEFVNSIGYEGVKVDLSTLGKSKMIVSLRGKQIAKESAYYDFLRAIEDAIPF